MRVTPGTSGATKLRHGDRLMTAFSLPYHFEQIVW